MNGNCSKSLIVNLLYSIASKSRLLEITTEAPGLKAYAFKENIPMFIERDAPYDASILLFHALLTKVHLRWQKNRLTQYQVSTKNTTYLSPSKQCDHAFLYAVL
jgi:hypothetical protein